MPVYLLFLFSLLVKGENVNSCKCFFVVVVAAFFSHYCYLNGSMFVTYVSD